VLYLLGTKTMTQCTLRNVHGREHRADRRFLFSGTRFPLADAPSLLAGWRIPFSSDGFLLADARFPLAVRRSLFSCARSLLAGGRFLFSGIRTLLTDIRFPFAVAPFPFVDGTILKKERGSLWNPFTTLSVVLRFEL
jgi:hypothetical protein